MGRTPNPAKKIHLDGKDQYISQVRWAVSEDRRDAARLCDMHFRRNGTRIGSTADALYKAGGEKLMEWLAANTPPDATISETLAAMALDALHEEEDANGG